MIYISHRLEEIRRLANRVTVLRDGESIGTQDAAHLDEAALVKWMVGRDVAPAFRRAAGQPGEVVLRALGLRNRQVVGSTLNSVQARFLAWPVWSALAAVNLPGDCLESIHSTKAPSKLAGELSPNIPLGMPSLPDLSLCQRIANSKGLLWKTPSPSTPPCRGHPFGFALAGPTLGSAPRLCSAPWRPLR